MRAPLLLCYAFYIQRRYEELFDGAPEAPLLFLDSGAFSARTQGIDIPVGDYARWLQRWAPHAMAYANLDVIQDPKATVRNQRILEDDYGLTPIPVFHAGTPWSELTRLLDAGYDYIGLGGLAAHSTSPNTRAWLAYAMRQCGPAVRTHGFGIGNIRLLRDFPFYSVDSSSFRSSWRYGKVRYLDRDGRQIQTHLDGIYAHGSYFRSIGIDPAHLAAGYGAMGSPFRDATLRLSLARAYELRTMMETRHGIIAPPARHASVESGPLVFIGGTPYDDVRRLVHFDMEEATR